MGSKKRTFYLVRPEFDNTCITYDTFLKNGRRKINTECLIGYEIITEWKFKRIIKATPNYIHIFDRITVKTEDTFWRFGAHFAINHEYNSEYIDYAIKMRRKLIKEFVEIYGHYKESKKEFRHFSEIALINYLNIDDLEECIRFYSDAQPVSTDILI